MADFSFLDSFYQGRQDNEPLFLVDLHRERGEEELEGRA